jgi:ribonuclease P protein component
MPALKPSRIVLPVAPSIVPPIAPLPDPFEDASLVVDLQTLISPADGPHGTPDQQKPGQLPKPGRLKRRAEFLRVAAAGKKAAIGGVVLQVLPRSDDGPVRLGFTVTRKVGNAVVRNRTRRRLKEAVRLLLRDCPVYGADLVLIGRNSTRERNFQTLQADIRRALDRSGAI